VPSQTLNPKQVRDLGALKIHVGQRLEGLQLLEGYSRWLETGNSADLVGSPPTVFQADQGRLQSGSSPEETSDLSTTSSATRSSRATTEAVEASETGASEISSHRTSAPVAQAQLVRDVLLFQRRKALESVYVGEAVGESPTEFLPADD
jgi:hypothetical protein